MAVAPRDLIDDDLTRFFRGPVSAILGSVDPMNVPDATRVVGLAAMSPRRLRILVSSEARAAHANAQPGSRVAVLVTDITDYRSIQLKGTVVTGPHERTAGDMALVHHHIDTFCEASPKVGLTPAGAARFFTVDVVAIVLDVDDLYDQTPGPGAGRRIVAGR